MDQQRISDDEMGGTDLALRLVATVRKLLDGGKHWAPTEMATDYTQLSCDPLSDNATFFNLRGSGVRARWMMREEIAATEVSQYHVRHVLEALSSAQINVNTVHRGWDEAVELLAGIEAALIEYKRAVRCAAQPSDSKST